MPTERVRRACLVVLAGLLLPTAYGMFTGNILLAGVCVGAAVVVRLVGLSRRNG